MSPPPQKSENKQFQHNFCHNGQIDVKIRWRSAGAQKINRDLEKYEFLEDFEPSTLVRPSLLSEILLIAILSLPEFPKFQTQS